MFASKIDLPFLGSFLQEKVDFLQDGQHSLAKRGCPYPYEHAGVPIAFPSQHQHCYAAFPLPKHLCRAAHRPPSRPAAPPGAGASLYFSAAGITKPDHSPQLDAGSIAALMEAHSLSSCSGFASFSSQTKPTEMSVPAVSSGRGEHHPSSSPQHRCQSAPLRERAAFPTCCCTVTFPSFTLHHNPSKANHSRGNPRAFHQPQQVALSTERKSCLL